MSHLVTRSMALLVGAALVAVIGLIAPAEVARASTASAVGESLPVPVPGQVICSSCGGGGAGGTPTYWPVTGKPFYGSPHALCPSLHSSKACALAILAAQRADHYTALLFNRKNPRARDDIVDAVVHVSWVAFMVRTLPRAQALKYALAQENHAKNKYAAASMDVHNDYVGLGLKTGKFSTDWQVAQFVYTNRRSLGMRWQV